MSIISYSKNSSTHRFQLAADMVEEKENISFMERLPGFEPVRATEMGEGYRVSPKFKCCWISARCIPSTLPVALIFPNPWNFLCYRHIPARSLHRPPKPNSVTTRKKNVNSRRRNIRIRLDHINTQWTIIWVCICVCSNPVTWPGLPAGQCDQSNRPEISACVCFSYGTVLYTTRRPKESFLIYETLLEIN